MRQIALPLDTLRTDNSGSLIITVCNADIVRALDNRQAWQGHCAILIGPARSGKSLMARYFAGGGGCDIVDDADGASDENLFNAWNRAKEAGDFLLLTSRFLPADWDVRLPDLRSRLGAAMLFEVGPPDDELITHLLQKHMHDRGMAITPEVMGFVSKRIERNYAALEKFSRDVNALALERGSAVGISLVKEILAQQ